ncbi:MAG: hypothetical protein ACE37M_17250 [Henriciella sp.]
MTHQVVFFPSGNADTCFIQLANGRKIIYDYANMFAPEEDADKRIDLEHEIRDRVGSCRFVSVLAFSHFDRDHYRRASELFFLRHAKKYQSNDRIGFETMWVPAAAILEEGITDEGRVLRAEARHRLIEGSGIRIFSAPHALDQWLRDRNIRPGDRAHLMTDAGQLAPEFSLGRDGIEFFVHSPFAEKCEDGSTVQRNASALFMQAKFQVEGEPSYLILSADCEYETLEQIVRITRARRNDERLLADINNIPHHCSYLSLSDEKGKRITVPSDALRWLYEEQSNPECIFVSTSDYIRAGDSIQPPHNQAAEYYKQVARNVGGQFIVTMEHPKIFAPEPLEIQITRSGPKTRKKLAGAATIATSTRAPRAGRC